MVNPKFLVYEKILLFVLLIGSLIGFWYFEYSLILRILVIVLAVAGSGLAFFNVSEKPQLSSRREFLILLVLYLGLFTLYNLLYGLSIPLFIIMIAILMLVSSLFFGIIMMDRIDVLIDKPLFRLFIILMGLAILEIFISLSYWPIDPKLKSLIIVVIFYIITNLIYLYVHSMLKLKRIAGYLIVSIIILSVIVLIIWLTSPK